MIRITIIFFLALVTFSCNDESMSPSYYQCNSVPENHRLLPVEGIQDVLEEYVDMGFPGITINLSDQNQSWTGSAGYADLYNAVPMEACHPMLIASISKVFVATLVFHLQEEGVLDIDDLLKEHLSGEFMQEIKNAKKVTIRQMLNHTSGLYDYLDPLKFELLSINEPFKKGSPADKLKLAYGKEPNHSPGEKYAYSNTNYVLLGLMLEKLSGQKLDQLMREVIFTPLGLSSAYMGTHQKPIPDGIPKGYLSIHATDDLQESAFWYHYDLATGDGGVAINMKDMSTFMMALHDNQLISEVSLNEMKASFELPDGWKGFFHESNGHGLEIYETPFGLAYGHTGGIAGFTSVSWYFPEENLTLSFAINGVSPKINGKVEDFAVDLMEVIFQ